MSREAWGDPPDPEPQFCPVCGEQSHTEGCEFGVMQKRALDAEMALALLRGTVGMAYGYLWCVNNEPGTPHQYPPERAAYEARKLLRDTMTQDQRGHFINTVLATVRGKTPNCGGSW